MDQEKFDACLTTAHELHDEYVAAYGRWFEKNRAWEMLVVAMLTDNSSPQDAWWFAARTPTGADALALLRDAGIQVAKAKYGLEIALAVLRYMGR
jgi:hypothetical protein